jgi:hypothetical protein
VETESNENHDHEKQIIASCAPFRRRAVAGECQNQNRALRRDRKFMNRTETKRLAGKFGITLCGAILATQTGCLPGMRGGPPGLPGLPGPPRVELRNPSGVDAAPTAVENLGQNNSPQFAHNGQPPNATIGESHE